MKIIAPAKINLYLWVGRRRKDGLHEVESVMQSVALYDTVTVQPSDVVSLDVLPAGSAPEDESNLVVKAVRSLTAAAGRKGGAALALEKWIPSSAGLGGGSADAAATLVGLNELWGCGISRKALEKLGAGVGADVPFCVRGGTAVARGAGEALAPLVVREPIWWLIVVPPGWLPTMEVYARFDQLATGTPDAPDPSEVADALARGDVDRLGAALRNDLWPAAESLMPGLGATGDALRAAGAVGAVMSGSGPAWVGLARDEAHADEMALRLRSTYERVWVACSVERGPRIIER